MDIINARVWERQHANRPEIRAIQAERQVIERFGEDSPQARELRAIPITRPATVLERASQLLAEPQPAVVAVNAILDQFVTDSTVAVDFLSAKLAAATEKNTRLTRELARKQHVIEYARRHLKQSPDAVAVIQRQEQQLREKDLRIYKLEQQLADAQSGSTAAELRAGMDEIRRILAPRGYTGPLLPAIKQLCEDRAHYERMHSLAQSQIDQVKRGYAKTLAAKLNSEQPAAVS